MLSLAYATRKLARIYTKPDLSSIDESNPDPDQLALLSVTGLVAGGLILGICRGTLEGQLRVQLVDVYVPESLDWMHVVGLAAAGLLVGLGSKVSGVGLCVRVCGVDGVWAQLSNGCTSGHMLCGVSRLSPRSLVASSIFVSFGIVTHLLLGQQAPFTLDLAPERDLGSPSWSLVLLLQLPILVYRYGAAFIKGFAGERTARRLVAFTTCKSFLVRIQILAAHIVQALYFALGLTLSGMLRPSKILNFMTLTPSAIRNGTWDPSLLLIIAGGILPQLLVWQCCLGPYVRRCDTRPAFASTWNLPRLAHDWRDGITARLVIGAVLFGMGWGLCGICPGPGAVLIGAGVGGKMQAEVWMRVGVWGCGFVVGGVFGGWI
jgi:uncharacterized membrane protein YedE/YeeE